MLPIVDIEIPKEVIVHCAEKDFKPRYATACNKCRWFAGVAIMCSDATLPWHKRYVIRCGHVIERRTHVMEVVED